jgi:mRNA-degrading endonuclease RelE of RelBE toxin-antitoxin system
MNLSVQRRAEITLRSLSHSERKRVLHKLNLLTDTRLHYSGEMRKLQSTDLYSYRADHLRIILSKNDAGWVVEDIMDNDKYRRLGLENKYRHLDLEARPLEKA